MVEEKFILDERLVREYDVSDSYEVDGRPYLTVRTPAGERIEMPCAHAAYDLAMPGDKVDLVVAKGHIVSLKER